MLKLIFTLDENTIREVPLNEQPLRIGRRPDCDVVLDDLSISGEHARVSTSNENTATATITDMGSTNGVFINNLRISEQVFQAGDVLQIGRYVVQVIGLEAADALATIAPTLADLEVSTEEAPISHEDTTTQPTAELRVLNGMHVGQKITLDRSVTRFGKRHINATAIERTEGRFYLKHIKGSCVATVNGISLIDGPIALKNNDQITLGNIKLRFEQ